MREGRQEPTDAAEAAPASRPPGAAAPEAADGPGEVREAGSASASADAAGPELPEWVRRKLFHIFR